MKFISLNNTYKLAIVDNEDYERLSQSRWWLSPQGYVVSKSRDKSKMMHRVVMNPDPEDYVDHKYRNKLDNRKINLRICSQSENMANSMTAKLNHYKGVSFYKNNKLNPWTAQVTKHYRKFHLGYFPTAKQAAKAYNKKAKELFGEYARLNNV